jgi:pyridoxamine 5'-phosphate oxidase
MSELHGDYALSSLDESRAGDDPVALLQDWLEVAARHSGLPEPTAMALATVDGEGRPANRIVLLRGFDSRGLQFFTNYESDKARQLALRPSAAVLFYWPALERQVRVEGVVARLEGAESDSYFAQRPRGSQVGAWASPQSRKLRFAGQESLPRPPHWGGYLLRPERFEFWQGRPSRLHDRIRFQIEPSGRWRRERLAP